MIGAAPGHGLRNVDAKTAHLPVGTWESVPVARLTRLPSIMLICCRSSPVSRRKTSRTSAPFRAGSWSNPSPPRDRVAFASSDLLHPPTHRLTLRRVFPGGLHVPVGDVRGSHVPLPECVGGGACCRPGGAWSTIPHVRDGIPPSSACWPKPLNLFGLLPVTTFITGSHMLTLPTT